MPGAAPLVALLLCASAAACAPAAAASAAPPPPPPPASLQAAVRLADGSHVQVQEFRGRPAWALHHAFTSATVAVECPSQRDFPVYAGRSAAAARAAAGRGERAWCGWARFTGAAPTRCVVALPVFGPAAVAVPKPRGWFGAGGGDAGAAACSMAYAEELSMPRLAAAALGAALFWHAPGLATSTPFRLAAGAAGFTALGAAAALFVLARALPRRARALAAAALALGGSLAAAARWAAGGRLLPTLASAAAHPLVGAYLAASALTGLALTYYFNDEANPKVNRMLRVALEGGGLAAVALSARPPGAGAAAAAALAAARDGRVRAAAAAAAAAARLGFAARRVRARRVARVAAAPAAAPAASPRAAAPAAAPATSPRVAAGAASPRAGGQVSPLVQRGVILNEATGRLIQIGKGTYNALVEEGAVVDRAAGTITPPAAGGGKGARSPGGAGSGGAGARRRVSGSRRATVTTTFEQED